MRPIAARVAVLLVCLVLAVLSLLPGFAVAQEDGATDGWVDVSRVEAQEWPHEVDCPLRLLVTLPSKAPSIRWSTISPRNIRCDNSVSVVYVGLLATKAKPRWKIPAGMKLVVEIKVDPSHDKVSEIRAEAWLDGELMARAGDPEVEVEEGRSKRVEVPMRFAAGGLERWGAGGSEAKLKLYVSAVDD